MKKSKVPHDVVFHRISVISRAFAIDPSDYFLYQIHVSIVCITSKGMIQFLSPFLCQVGAFPSWRWPRGAVEQIPLVQTAISAQPLLHPAAVSLRYGRELSSFKADFPRLNGTTLGLYIVTYRQN